MPYKITEQEIKDSFDVEIVSVKIVKDWKTGKSMGYGYIEVVGDTKDLIGEKMIGGRTVKIQDAEQRFRKREQKADRKETNSSFKESLGL